MLFSKKNLKRFFGLSLFDKLIISVEIFKKFLQKKMNFKGRYTLCVDNRKNFNDLLIIIAGYQEYTWECVFDRVKKYAECSMDVIIVSNGKYCEELKLICEKNQRSYLFTKPNKVALGLNIAIKLHKNAQFIYKMDEDIFITKNLFRNLKDKYNETLENGPFYPGGVTPILNINGFTYIHFLETIGKQEEFKNKFNIKGPLKQRLEEKDNNIRYSGNVAEYIWENTLDIDSMQNKFFASQNIKENFIANSIRYSIGCFMFPRQIREKMGGFHVSIEKVLGEDESEYLNYCINNSFPLILCENSLVGHLSFGPQKKHMESFFEKNKALFFINNQNEK